MRYSLILLAILLSGCNEVTKRSIEIVEIPTPVISCPKPPNVVKPDDLTTSLTMGSTNLEVVKAYLITLKQYQSYINQLESIIEMYTNIDTEE
jgi:hypothetical protein